RIQQTGRSHEILRRRQSQRGSQPFFLERPVDACAPVHSATQSLWFRVRELRRPVSAEAPAHNCDPLAVDIVAGFEIVDGRRKGSFGAGVLPEAWVFTGARHIDGEGRQTLVMKKLAIGSPIFLPT